jgi:hypothetical protein
MPINSQRWFQRKEEYAPRQAQPDSPCRCFDVKCLKCGCYKLTVTTHYDEPSGETLVVLFCTCLQGAGKIWFEALT